MKETILYYSRNPRMLHEEIVWGDAFIRWAYYCGSSWLQKRLFESALFSQLLGYYFDTRWSKFRINNFIKYLKINTDEILRPLDAFRNFNDFFIRQLKSESRPYDLAPQVLIAPAEGRALFFPRLDEMTKFKIKGQTISMADLIPDSYAPFVDGTLVIIRLNPSDYHRFHFPCDCQVRESYAIAGGYHSVNPISFSAGFNAFEENRREVTLLHSDYFGWMAMVEIGAFGVGKIIQTFTEMHATKMQEKGYFKFGGSTVLLILQKEKVLLDEDLINNSAEGIETYIKVGERLGRMQ